MCHCLKLSSNTTGICLRQHIFSKEKRIWQIFNGLLRKYSWYLHYHWSANLKQWETPSEKMLINTISMWTYCLKCLSLWETILFIMLWEFMWNMYKFYLSQTTVQHHIMTECILARKVFFFFFFFTGIKTSSLTHLLFFQLLNCFPFIFSERVILLSNGFQWPTVQFHYFSGLENTV